MTCKDCIHDGICYWQKDKSTAYDVKHSYDEIHSSGELIITKDWSGNGFECSECGRLRAENKMPYMFKFCPNCGRDMR